VENLLMDDRTGRNNNSGNYKNFGKGKIVEGPYTESSFDTIGIKRDVVVSEAGGKRAEGIAWTHRTSQSFDIYFLSNQENRQRVVTVSLRVSGRVPELFDPVSGEVYKAEEWRIENGRTVIPVRLEASGSLFIVFHEASKQRNSLGGKNWKDPVIAQTLKDPWLVTFDPKFGGPAKPVTFNNLTDWSKNTNPEIQYYSGTAKYTSSLEWQPGSKIEKVLLNIGKVANIAEVIVNGINCGVAWTAPYSVEITKAIRAGKNEVVIEVSNTWANRLIRDRKLPESERITRTKSPWVLEGKPLLEAGLLGPVTIQVLRGKG
jgi:hypothetical protein